MCRSQPPELNADQMVNTEIRLLLVQPPVLNVDQMVNTEVRLIIFFAAKDGEALYSQEKQDQELTVAQIMNSLLPNSD